MDLDIQFGELEEAQPEVHLRPDRNKHFAVVEHEAPAEGDLPIFVDLDVMRDMETHAQTDTSVELGGVLLGGQYHDESGEPFVVVTDSLRAEHYEATKGSFKFTHDTWEKISRERDEFPATLQMVGWYHTHPDWGVFLSGMDMFICDNFFNRPLDLALVIDPCRGDRGMFMWTGDERQRIRRTGGFYVTASRFRAQELALFAAQLEGKLNMAIDPRLGGYPVQLTSPPPVVNISEPRNSWQGPAMMGMLALQFLALMLIAWKLIDPSLGQSGEPEKKDDERVAKLEDRFETYLETRTTQREIQARQDAQSDILQRIVAEIHGEEGGLAEDYEKATQERDFAYEREKAALSHAANLRRERDNALRASDESERKLSIKENAAKKLEGEIAALEAKNKDLQAAMDAKEDKAPAGDGASAYGWWLYAAIGAGVIVVIAVAAAGVLLTRRGERLPADGQPSEYNPRFSEDSPAAANNDEEESPPQEDKG